MRPGWSAPAEDDAPFGRRWRRGIRSGDGHPGWPGGAEAVGSAEKILAERFAQGDIGEIEYRARLDVLRPNRPGPQAPSS